MTRPAIAIFETVAAVARKNSYSVDEARAIVARFLSLAEVTLVPVDEPVGQAALLAFERYGKGRHHASLNMGDCFAYGCASEALPRPCAAAVSNAKRRRVGRGGKTCDRPARPWPSPSEKRWRRKFGLRAKGRWATTREKYERGAETFERSGDLRDQTLAKDLRRS
jgi:hypothetical protein